MKTGDEVYIKSEGEGAERYTVKFGKHANKDFIGIYKGVKFLEWAYLNELKPLKPTERLVSELPEIAKMTGCYVAVNEEGDICLSENKMTRGLENWWKVLDVEPPEIRCTITCPNCEDFTRQWGPNGEVME